MNPRSTSAERPRDERIGEAIASWVDARDAGRPFTPSQWVDHYPDELREELLQFLEDEGVVLPPEMLRTREQPPPSFGPYEIGKKLGAGGMGAVYQAYDRVLKRAVAIKALLTRHKDVQSLRERFLEEAQVAAQLQHPCIVPVHAVGALPDGRPFFTMKLVKGKNLGEMLAERPSPKEDLPRFLVLFEQICLTLAYAHDKRVLHRDLKPSNVMVGAFGEVQVMDWGLSKILNAPRAQPSEHVSSVVETNRHQANIDLTRGALGTFAYMAPEQARGEVIGPQSDVFGLGAILCEILTGAPPYAGAPEEIPTLARTGSLGGAFKRLEACGADPTLVRIVKACLDPDPARRPAGAAAVAKEIEVYQAGVREQLRRAELERAAAEARLKSEQSRRRWQLALAGTVALGVVLLSIACVVGMWWDRQSQEKASREIESSLTRVDFLLREGRRLMKEKQYQPALAAADQALEALSRADAVARAEHRAGLAKWKLAVQEDRALADRELNRANREAALLKNLEEAALEGGLRLAGYRVDTSESSRQHARAFLDYGVDLEKEKPEEVIGRLRELSLEGQAHVIDALDRWSVLDRSRAARLHEIASGLDSDAWRVRLRDAWRNRHVTRLEQLASPEGKLTAGSSLLLAEALEALGKDAEAIEVLRAARQREPDHFWVNFALGNFVQRQGRTGLLEAANYYWCALARLPDSAAAWNNLGQIHILLVEPAEAKAAFDRALRSQPSCVPARCGAAVIALCFQQDFTAAERILIEARAHGVAHAPPLKALFGLLRISQGKQQEGHDLLREAYRAEPHNPLILAVNFMGDALLQNWRDAATDAEQLARALGPHHPMAPVFSAFADIFDGDLPAAERKLREGKARFGNPPYDSHFDLCLAALSICQGRPAEAEALAHGLAKRYPHGVAHLAVLPSALLRQGKIAELRPLHATIQKVFRDRFPGQAAPALVNLLFAWLEGAEAKLRTLDGVEDPELALDSGILAELALAGNKPYLAHRLYYRALPTRPDDTTLLDRWTRDVPAFAYTDLGLMNFTLRFSAARAAIGAGLGQGTDRIQAPPEQRARLLARGLELMTQELEAREAQARDLEKQPGVRRWVYYCRACPELACVRADELTKRGEEEQKRWRAWWDRLDRLGEKLEKEAPRRE